MEPPSCSYSSGGVKRGAWTESEDSLLRQCVEKHGEGNWYRVPERAGLNRCRKSCRLRWLNYLHPNIKRGEFSYEEVDLIIKMHKLLGNRWSMIAARFPGRTANDIKNHWNTHIDNKKLLSASRQNMINHVRKITETATLKTKPTKPRPHRLSKNFQWGTSKNTILTNPPGKVITVVQSTQLPPYNESTTTELLEFKHNQSIEWWESILFHDQEDKNETHSITIFGEDCSSTYLDDGYKLAQLKEIESNMNDVWNDICLDFDKWEEAVGNHATMQPIQRVLPH